MNIFIWSMSLMMMDNSDGFFVSNISLTSLAHNPTPPSSFSFPFPHLNFSSFSPLVDIENASLAVSYFHLIYVHCMCVCWLLNKGSSIINSDLCAHFHLYPAKPSIFFLSIPYILIYFLFRSLSSSISMKVLCIS